MREPVKYGNYYLLERVNIGGMAEVFKGVSYGVEGFERLFAVKRVLPNIAEDQEFIEMFIDEAKIAVQLNHANIGQIFELGNAENSYFIAMEFVQGKDLRAIFDRVRKRTERIDISMTCHVIKEVCEALEYAHNKKNERQEALNLVHRDVSPQNIIVSYDGEVKLIDFGIAKAAGKASKTQAGILKGKFGYMSPEQVRGRPIDRRSDIFSLGVVLFELLTLERCFQGESDFSTLEKVRNVDIRRPATLNRDIPPELERIVLKALSRNPEERYQSAAELQDGLQKFLYQSGSFYSRKDLAVWMKRTFDADIRQDHVKLAAFREYAREYIPEASRAASQPAILREPDTQPSPSASASSQNVPVFKPQLPSLSWEDDELATSVWDQKPSDIVALADVQGTPAGSADPPAFAAAAASTPLPLPSDARPALPDTELVLPAQSLPVRPRGRDKRMMALVSIAALAILCAVVFVSIVLSGAGPARLHIESQPPVVSVFLDNAPVFQGRTPAEVPQVAPGHHLLRVEAEGYQPYAGELNLQPDTEQPLNVILAQLHAGDQTGLEINSDPSGAQVYLDGHLQSDQTPMEIGELTPGEHELRLEKAGRLPYKGRVSAVAGQMVSVKPVRLLPAKVNVAFTSAPRGAKVTLESSTGEKVEVGLTPTTRIQGLDNAAGYTAVGMLSGYPDVHQYFGFSPEENFDVPLTFENPGATPPPVASQAPGRPQVAYQGQHSANPSHPTPREDEPSQPATEPPAPATDPPPQVTVTPVGPGYLSIMAKPPGIAFIDEESAGETPILKRELTSGSHHVTIVREADPKPYRRTFTVEIRPGENSKINHVEP